jgi:hypothetical protein
MLQANFFVTNIRPTMIDTRLRPHRGNNVDLHVRTHHQRGLQAVHWVIEIEQIW